MEINEMNYEEIEARLQQIEVEKDNEDANITELTEEVRQLAERKKELNKIKEERKELERQVKTSKQIIRSFDNKDCEVDKKMTNEEVRSTTEYAQAYANFIKTGKDAECRSILTENITTGTVPVPTMLADKINHAWDSSEIMMHVNKTSLKGNVRVGFELSATGANVHVEGSAAPTEEVLTLGIVEIKPESIKKWITISDEVVDMDAIGFLNYIYDEIAYQIVRKACNILIGKIVALPDTATSTSVSAKKIALAPAVGTIATAIANLSDEASNPIICMNKLTYADFKKAQYDNKYAVDAFEGLTVVFDKTLPKYDATTTAGTVYCIVGDFSACQVNFPSGDIDFKYDELSLAEKDLVKIVGREFVGMGIVKDKCFTLLTCGK